MDVVSLDETSPGVRQTPFVENSSLRHKEKTFKVHRFLDVMNSCTPGWFLVSRYHYNLPYYVNQSVDKDLPCPSNWLLSGLPDRTRTDLGGTLFTAAIINNIVPLKAMELCRWSAALVSIELTPGWRSGRVKASWQNLTDLRWGSFVTSGRLESIITPEPSAFALI